MTMESPDALSSSALGIGLDFRMMLRKSSRFSIISVLGAVLGIPVSLIVARVLGPEMLGKTQFVLLAYSYAGLVRLGAFEGAQRQLIHDLAIGKPEDGLRAQNIGLTIDLIISALPGIAIFAFAFTATTPVRQLGFALAPLAVMASSFSSYLSSLHLAHHRFNLVSNFNLFRQIGALAALAIAVPFSGFRAVILVPIAFDLLTILGYKLFAPSLRISFHLERRKGVELLLQGFPLGAMAFVYWAYRLAGSTSAALWGSVRTLAFFTFAVAPVSLAIRALGGVSTVLGPSLWKELARAPNAQLRQQARHIVMIVAVGGGLFTNLAQAGFLPLISAAAPRFLPARAAFAVLAFDIVLYAIPIVPSLLLDSITVNRQWQHLRLWAGALILNLVANYVVLQHHFGVFGLAVVDASTQFLVMLALLRMARKYLVEDGGWIRFGGGIAAVLALASLVAGVLQMVPQGEPSNGSLSLAVLAIARVAGVIALWSPACWLTLRLVKASTKT